MSGLLTGLCTAWRIFRILRGYPNGAAIDIRPRKEES